MNRLEELLLLWQDQSIGEAELAELKQLLADPAARARAAEEFFLTGVILEAVQAQGAARQPTTPDLDPPSVPLRRGRWRGVAWLSGAAAALLAAAGILWFSPAPPTVPEPPALAFAQLEEVQGETFVVSKEQRSPAQAGQVLERGQGIATQGESSEAVVHMHDDVRLKLGGDTMVLTSTADEPDATRLVFERGELLVEINRRLVRRKMTVQTALGVAVTEADDTALHVSDAAGVIVMRGEVNFLHTASGKSIRVRGGQYVVATQDGELYAARLLAGEANVWSTFKPGFTDAVAVAFSRDGRQLAAASHADDFGIRLGAVDGPPAPLKLAGDRCLAFSPDGKLLAAGDVGQVLLHDTASGQPVRILAKKGPRVRITALAFSPDGRTLAASMGSRTTPGDMELWDVKTGELLASWRSHPLGVPALAFSPDGKLLASGSWDKTVVLWDTETRQEKTRVLMIPALAVRSLAFAPDGQTLAIATGPADPRLRIPGEIKFWDVVDERVRGTLYGHTRTVTSLAYSADGQTLVSGSADTTVRFWDPMRLRQYGMLKGHKAAPGFEGLAVALSPVGDWLASASFDHTVKLWKVDWKKEPAVTSQARWQRQHTRLVGQLTLH